MRETRVPTYLERYLAGEHEQVWADLLALGDRVRQEPLYADALAVARETMRRVRHNIEVLIPRLTAWGYHFGYENLHVEPGFASRQPGVFRTPEPRIAGVLDAFETTIGVLPLSLYAWYETIGG
jgi:hypothetical protein